MSSFLKVFVGKKLMVKVHLNLQRQFKFNVCIVWLIYYIAQCCWFRLSKLISDNCSIPLFLIPFNLHRLPVIQTNKTKKLSLKKHIGISRVLNNSLPLFDSVSPIRRIFILCRRNAKNIPS